jgi:type III restriction enzyme
MRVQVRQTVQDHLEKELAVHRQLPENQRLKVLSLFFIDRVAHYYEQDGRIRQWFVEAYQEMAAKSRYKKLKLPPVEEVHNGYFACSKKGEPKDTSGKTQADDEAYALIMQDKERLLSRSEPLRFIFSHSALREGWDNPNVFQICTLNETRSEIKKRQEIGRGLRLPVQEDGNRCFDPSVNRLTVVANEAYDDFARQLQTEIEEECGVSFGGGRIKNAKDRRKARLKKNWRFDENFLALWEKIKHKTRYRVEYDTKELIRRASRELQQMPAIEAPVIRTQKAAIDMTDEGLASTVLAINETNVQNQQTAIPDLLGYLQRETELTRTTLADILIESNRLDEVAKNPQEFMDQAARAVRQALDQLIIDGIKYERIEGAEYEMMLFEEKEIEGYASRMLEVKSSIYDAIEYDSENEKDFAKALDERDDVKLFLKLPPWFTVETPLGQYNPDWAIVKQPEGQDAKLYLVRETKTSKDKLKLRGTEWGKLKCGKAHFDALGVDFDHITSPEEV